MDERAKELLQRSVVYKAVAVFPQAGRALYVMTRDGAQAAAGTLGNVLFDYREPVLRLRWSDQQLLLTALRGATDAELATATRIDTLAVKARWRSTFKSVAAALPDLAANETDESRGSQKRHRVLGYVRNHPEELRPFEWKVRAG